MLLRVNMEQCILCGVCESFFPEAFKQGRTIEVNLSAARKDVNRVRTCEVACPMQCIEVNYNP